MNWYANSEAWSFILYRYLPRLTLCSLVWEIVQLPFYTLWAESRPGNIVYAVAHCSVGDAMIGTTALFLALTMSGAGERANWPRTRIVILMIFSAVAYTVFSERINLAQGNWAYSIWMPVLPWLKVGLTPLLQWILVPLVAWWWANRLRELSS